MDHNQSDVDVPAGGRLPVIGQEPCQPAAAELRDKQRKSSEAHDRCVLKARFDIETAVIHDKYVWCDSYDRGATIRVPLIDDDVDWHADMDLCEPHYWEKDGNVLVKAGVRSDLLQKDLDFIEELRLMFPRAYREREKARAVVLAGFERTSEAAKVEMERTDECDRASRARHGRGGYRKVWDGTVVGPEKKRVPVPAAHVDVEKAKIDAAVAKLDSQIKLEEKKRELRRLQKAEEPKKTLEARQAEDAVSMARLKCEHDFVYADLDRPLSTWEVNKLASGGDQIETAEDFVAEGLADGIECPRVSCYSFGQADYIRLFEDRRDHTYRSSSVYGEGFTLRSVTQTTFGPRTFSSSKTQRIWGAVIYLLLRVLYYIDLIYYYFLREHMNSYIWLLKKRTASVQYEGKICWQLYLELLSRKVIGVKPDAYTTYKRMLTRYQNYSTLNLPAELNGTGVLENTFRLAFSRFCAMNNYRVDADFIFPETDDADSINESSSDIISEMLVCPLSGESRIVCVQFAAVPMRPIETLRSPRAWVLWFLGLFRPCQAAATYGRPNSVCVNVLALIMAWSLAQLLIGFASLPKSTVSEISLRWQQMRYQQSGYGSISLTILLSAALISWRLPPEAGLMLMTMVWVLSIVAERRRLTRLSKPSSIATLKHLASFVPALITRSVFTVLLLLPLSMGFTTLTTTLSNMFLSLTGHDTSAELSEMARWSLRVITVLLSAILLKISCTLLNLCCTDIFSKNIHNYHGLDLGSEEGFNKAFAPISETNKICLLGNVYSVAATRMSGEMFTSLGNGFTNLMVMLCFMEECGISGVDGVVEGDDGLYAVPQRFAGRIPDTKFFADRGFNVKLAVRESVNEATFCSMVFDSETLHVLKEPTFALARLGWVPRSYIGKHSKRLGLLRAKLTSLLYECSCCPILGAAAFHGLRLTSGVLADWSLLLRSSYYRDELLAAMRFDCSRLPVPSPGDRKLFSKHFNISEEEQLRIEQEFAECEDIDKLLSGRYLRLLFERLAPPSWQLNSDQFTEMLYRGEPVELINRPERINPQCRVDVGLTEFIDRCSPPAHHTEPEPT